MTRKAHTVIVITQLFGVLAVLVALLAPAQTSGVGQPSGKSHAAPGSGDVGAPLLAQERPLLRGGANAERALVSRVQKKRLGVQPMTPDAPLFLPAVKYSSGGNLPDSVVVADVNGDGKPDLLVDNSGSSTAGVLLGNGDGTFQPAISYGSGGFNEWPQFGSVAAADVNGDGRVDLVVTNTCVSSDDCSNGTVGVLLGNGDGTFQPVVIYSSGAPAARSVAIADLNSDGRLDLAIANCGNSSGCAGDGVVGVLLGNGDGTFQAAVTYDSGAPQAISIAIGDVNGDDKPDLLVANGSGTGRVDVLLGNGDGTFRTAVGYKSLNAQAVAVADVNGDSKPDLVTANSESGGCASGDGSAGVLLGNGDGTFEPEVSFDSGGCVFIADSVAVANINRDGKPDLLVANYCASGGCSANGTVVGVLLGNGDGTFQPAVTSNTGSVFALSLAVADLNGDGAPDVVVADSVNEVGVLLNATGARKPTTTTLVSAPDPSAFGQAVTLTAAVSSPSGTPAGTVAFFDGPSELGSKTLVSGSASISVTSLTAGPHSITATYQGGAGFGASTSAPLHQVVNKAMTATALASSVNPARVKQSVTYTGAVTGQYGGALTGTVAFQDGGSTVATVALESNQAAFSTSYSKPGTHAITATYSGDANNSASLSPTLVEQIKRGFPSVTVLATSGSPSQVGQPVTFTATVTSSHGPIPDGELVTFYDGATTIGTAATASSVATFTTSSLAAKTHTIKATYVGDAIFQPSSGTVTQVVNKYPTTTTLTSSPNPSQSGQAVTFTAQVTGSGPAPTGKVKFLDGATSLGSATLSGGVAKLTKATLSVGTHPITAQYLGDAVSAKSASSVVNQVVQ